LAITEEEEEDIPTLPDPPVFHGHPKKDNLPVVLHDLKMWFKSVQGISSSMSKERVSDLLERAIPFQSQPHDWYESKKEELLAQVSAAETDQLDALYRLFSTAIGFEHILGDKEQELWAMVLKPSDNLADFASRYCRLAKKTRVDTGKAVRLLKVAVQRCAPTLASQKDFDMLQLEDEVSLDKVIAYAKRLSRIQAMDEQSGTSNASRGAREAEPQEVRYIDRPCILPGHGYHSMHECKTLRLQAQQAKQAQQHVQHSHGRGSRGEHISMHTPAAMHSNATYNHNTSTHDAQQAGLQQQIADLSRAVQGMHVLLTTQNVGAGFGGGYNNNSAPHATRQHFAAMNTQQQKSAGYGRGGGGCAPGRPLPCNWCRRLHHPQAMCYGPRYENRPVVQPGPPALLTAPPMGTNVSERSESAFASNADIQWPSLNSMIGIVGDSCMSAAAPLPFTQGKRADMQASSTNAPVQPTLPPAQPEHAKIALPLASLTLQQLQSLKENCPDAHVEVKVQVPVAMALLKRTDMLATASPPVSSSTAPNSSTINPIASSSVPPCKRDADGMPDLSSYLEQTAGVYKVSEGFSLAYEGRSLGGLKKVSGTLAQKST